MPASSLAVASAVSSLRLLGGRTPGFNHVNADEQQDHSAGYFEGRQRDAEHAEDQLAREGKGHQYDQTGERSATGHALLALAIGTGSDGKESWDRGKGIDEKKDGADRQHRESHVVRVQGVHRDACRSVHALNLQRLYKNDGEIRSFDRRFIAAKL